MLENANMNFILIVILFNKHYSAQHEHPYMRRVSFVKMFQSSEFQSTKKSFSRFTSEHKYLKIN